ncbi:hypothetical protein D9M68_729830 [compost metagenome]
MGERVMAPLGLTGIALSNVSDGCVSGYGAFHLARQSILAGEAECALAVGFDDMPAGLPSRAFFGLDDLPNEEWEELVRSEDPLDLLGRRQFPAALARQDQPAFDRVPAKARKGHIEHVHRLERRLGRHDAHRPANGPGFGNGRIPKGRKVGGRLHRALIGAKLGLGQIGKGHG